MPLAGSRYRGTVKCRECGIYYDHELFVHDHTAKGVVHGPRWEEPSFDRDKGEVPRPGPKPKVLDLEPWEDEEDEAQALIGGASRTPRRPSKTTTRDTIEAALLKDRVEEMKKTMNSVEIMQTLWAELVPHGRRALYTEIVQECILSREALE